LMKPLGYILPATSKIHPERLAKLTRANDIQSAELLTAGYSFTWPLEKALADDHPARFIQTLRDCGALAELWPEIDRLFGVPQKPQYHPEIDTGVHLLMTLDMARSMQVDVEVVFACLLHDLGKGVTPLDVLPAHRGHELAGVPIVEEFCERMKAPTRFRKLARAVCEHHLRCHRVLEMRSTKVLDLIEAVGGIRNPQQFEWFLQACEADFRGRGGNTDAAYPQADYLRRAFAAVSSVSVADFAERGFSGPEIGEELYRRRVEAIRQKAVKPGQ
jgi:tRNA nucleotidyltransferase (CCA-adding enzyme)